MYYNIKTGSFFMSMNQRAHQPWRRDLIAGLRDGSWKMHIATSGAATAEFHDTWFARVQDNVFVLSGSETIPNASQLLSDCIPNTLKEFQNPEQPLSWNVKSLDSFFLSQKNN